MVIIKIRWRFIRLKKKIFIILILFSFILLLIGCTNSTKPFSGNSNELIIHFINVGQGDSILIQVNNKNLLIDAGPKSSRKDLIDYLDDLKLKNIDYIIATHPHEDHIGGMAKVIDNYTIGKFYAPKITHTSKTFEGMINSLKRKNLKINTIIRGTNSIDLGNGTTFTVFPPEKTISEESSKINYNDYSPIIKLTYYNTSFLFTGDSEELSEKKLIENNDDIATNVLKLGHHGSETSTSEEFLNRVNPSIAVASLGYLNEYGHPHKKTLDKLKTKNITLYRTDIDGTIILTSDGNKISKI